MSNSQNKKNEQQNNLCTTLTEQWKKGELEKGYYYVKEADGLFGIMSDYGLYRVNLEHPDNTISLLAKIPSYEEYQQLHKFLEEFNALEVAEENKKLKDLLGRCKYPVILAFNRATEDDADEYCKLWDEIDEAIGEKK